MYKYLIKTTSQTSKIRNILDKEKELFEYTQQKFANNPSIWNPVFDITPADLVDVLVTEKGVIKNPNAKKLRKVIK